jgi:hypothetical protein
MDRLVEIFSRLLQTIILFSVPLMAFAGESKSVDDSATQHPLPDRWKLYAMPAERSEEWMKANHSDREWQVFLVDAKLKIEKARERSRNSDIPEGDIRPFKIVPALDMGGYRPSMADHFLKVEDGWILGFNAGEFGGGLYWFDVNGKSRYRLELGKDESAISPDNVHELISYKDSVLAFEGLAHLLSSEGKVVKATRQADGKWKAELFAKLPGAPYVVVKEKEESWVVVTSGSALRLKSDGKLEELVKMNFISLLYPSSMVKAPDGALYIGMRHFVARLLPEKNSYRIELLVPEDLPLFTPGKLGEAIPPTSERREGDQGRRRGGTGNR